MNSAESPIPLVLATRNQKKKAEMLRLISPDWEPNDRLARLSILTLADFGDLTGKLDENLFRLPTTGPGVRTTDHRTS